MKAYRRAYQPGGCYFFTVVTHRRVQWLTVDSMRIRLREALLKVAKQRPFGIDAFVLLPDHLHAVWRLPQGDCDFSSRWRLIKHHASTGGGPTCAWQPRFWEHVLRDERDWRRHVDYVHYNPVKHGLARAPGDWPYSTFARAVGRGWYSPDWGRSEPPDLPSDVGE
ncbi:REP-associated tyrosine transposase [Dokdonella sp.]|uniref:REP-associated tyrosine transposase n=1 Tax=Dokdonella sp. TaxID=2291710 RepID=UPI002F403346